MATAYAHLEARECILRFGQDRVHEIESDIKKLQAEKGMWEEIIDSQNPCGECGGHGELREILGPDGSKYFTCPKCGGDGEQKPL